MYVEYTRENGCLGNSEISINDAIEVLERFSPVQISFNGVIIYDDYDCEETEPFKDLICKRLWKIEKYTVTSIKIEIVDFHHTIIKMYGEYCND